MAQTFQGRFKQAGSKIDHTPGSALSAGDVVVQTSLVGITPVAIAANAVGSLQVQGIVDIVKITGTIAAGVAVYWDANGDPLGGVSSSGAVTATAGGNTFVGFVVTAAASGDEFAVVFMVPAISVTAAQLMRFAIADPGASGAIPATDSGSVALVSGGVETRTLADPTVVGIMLNIYQKTDGGTITLTTASPMNQAGNNTLAFADVGDSVQLIAIEDGSDIEWRIVNVDGMTPSTV